MARNKTPILIFIAIFILSLVLRFAFLTADPFPYTLFGATWFDEGALAHNARNLALFGDWFIDGDIWNPLYFSPTHTYLTAIFFKLLGVSTFSMRLVPVILGITSIIILAAFLYKKDREEGIALLILLAINPMLIAYSRISIAESSLLFFITLIMGLIIHDRKYSWAIIGFLTPFLFFSKISSAFFVASIPISLFFHGFFYRSQKSLRNLKTFILGFTISLIIWLFWLIPNFNNWVFMNFGNHGDRIGITSTGLAVALLRAFEFLLLNPLLVIVTLSYFIIILFKIKGGKRINYLSAFLVTTLFLFLIQIILVDYSLRRFVLLLPLFAFFSIRLISKTEKTNLQFNGTNFEFDNRKLLYVFVFLYLIISLAQLAPLYTNIVKDQSKSYTLISNSEEIANYLPYGTKVYGKHALSLGLENGVVPYFGSYLNPLGNQDENIIPLLEQGEINFVILKLNIFDEKDIREYDRDINKSAIYKHIYENFEIIKEIESIHTRTNEPDTVYIYKRKT